MAVGRCAAVVAAIVAMGCGKAVSNAPAPTAASVSAVEAELASAHAEVKAAQPTETPVDRMSKLGYADALAMARPLMGDTRDAESDGATLFALWAAKHMSWADVAVPKDETTWALTVKDSDETRGKRLCASGQVLQIEVEGTNEGKLGVGLTRSKGGNLYHFIAVGSTGDLVEESSSRLCGVVTGKYDYSNRDGGTGHAVSIVGMFDLPQNRPEVQPSQAPHDGVSPALPK